MLGEGGCKVVRAEHAVMATWGFTATDLATRFAVPKSYGASSQLPDPAQSVAAHAHAARRVLWPLSVIRHNRLAGSTFQHEVRAARGARAERGGPRRAALTARPCRRRAQAEMAGKGAQHLSGLFGNLSQLGVGIKVKPPVPALGEATETHLGSHPWYLLVLADCLGVFLRNRAMQGLPKWAGSPLMEIGATQLDGAPVPQRYRAALAPPQGAAIDNEQAAHAPQMHHILANVYLTCEFDGWVGLEARLANARAKWGYARGEGVESGRAVHLPGGIVGGGQGAPDAGALDGVDWNGTVRMGELAHVPLPADADEHTLGDECFAVISTDDARRLRCALRTLGAAFFKVSSAGGLSRAAAQREAKDRYLLQAVAWLKKWWWPDAGDYVSLVLDEELADYDPDEFDFDVAHQAQ